MRLTSRHGDDNDNQKHAKITGVGFGPGKQTADVEFVLDLFGSLELEVVETVSYAKEDTNADPLSLKVLIEAVGQLRTKVHALLESLARIMHK